MANDWSSMHAIMQDLLEAQGSKVPAVVDMTVIVDGKPSTPKLFEETEEEYYQDCCTGEEKTVPNLKYIKEMLHMFNEQDKEPENDDNYYSISKSNLNPTCQEFVPRQTNTSTNLDFNNIKVNRKNVAMNSLLKMEKENNRKSTNFLISNGHVINEDNIESVVKVNGVLDKDNAGNITSKVRSLTMNPTNMFRKKVKGVTKENEGVIKNTVTQIPSQAINECCKPTQAVNKRYKSPQPDKPPMAINEQYKPTPLATSYYNKYIEKSKKEEKLENSLWGLVSLKLQEVDDKRKTKLQSPETPDN